MQADLQHPCCFPSSLILDPGLQLRSAATARDRPSPPSHHHSHHHSLHTHRPVPPIGLSVSRAKGHVKFTQQGISPLTDLMVTALKWMSGMSRICPIRRREEKSFRQIFTSPQVILPRLVWLSNIHDFLTCKTSLAQPIRLSHSGYSSYKSAATFQVSFVDVAGLVLFIPNCVIVFALSAHIPNQERVPGTKIIQK